MSELLTPTHEELIAERAALFASAGMEPTLLMDRGQRFALYPEHRRTWRRIEQINYLLGGDDD